MLHTAGFRQVDTAASWQLRGDAKVDKENAQAADRLPVASKPSASSAPLKQQAAPSRRPLGNITNSANKAVDKAGAGDATKKSAPAPTTRRAFGDITNAGPQVGRSAAFDAKPSVVPLPGPKVTHPTATRVKVSVPRPALMPAADEPVERLAGKGWEQLEAERLQQEDNTIRQRVQMMTSSLAMWPAPSLQSLSNSTRRQSGSAPGDRDDMDMSPEPVMRPATLSGRQWASRGSAQATPSLFAGLPVRPVSPGTLELLTSPSPDCQSLSDLLMSSEEEDLLL